MTSLFAATEWFNVVGAVFSVALSLLLVALVLIQKEKGGGLAGAFGGTGTVSTFGVKTSDALSKLTWFFFIAWLVISLGLAVLNNGNREVDVAPTVQETPVAPGEGSN